MSELKDNSDNIESDLVIRKEKIIKSVCELGKNVLHYGMQKEDEMVNQVHQYH